MLEEWLVPFPGHLCLLVELIECFAIPQAAMDLELLRVAVQCDGVCCIGLKFDGICTGLVCFFYYFKGRFQAAVMVGRQFGNNVRRAVFGNASPRDRDVR